MNYLKNNKPFFLSIFSGLIIWIIIFFFLPVNSLEYIQTKSILFIVANYLCLFIGYIVFNFKTTKTTNLFNYNKLLGFLVVLISVGFLIRFLDLFLVRNMSFNNSININRSLSNTSIVKNNLLLYLASIIKSLYFFPLIIILSIKQKPKFIYIIISYILLFLPIIEAVLKGTRKPFLELFIILIFTFLLYKKIKINKTKITLFVIGITAVVFISNSILIKRETEKNYKEDIYTKLLNARYTHLIPSNRQVKSIILDPQTSEIKKNSLFTFLHFGQYLTHGFFEFNHIVKSKNQTIGYGGYTFYPITKFFKVIGAELRIKEVKTDRKGVYITAFGGLYLDFRWFSLVIMFLFGVFQKLTFQKAVNSVIWRPLLIYILIINVFLCVINYVRGAGIYPFIGFFLILVITKLPLLNLHEKSINT